MLKKTIIAVGLLALSMTPSLADVAANKEIVRNMMSDVFRSRDASAVDKYFAEDYIQHNPMVPSGSAPIKKFLSKPVDANAPKRPPNEMHRIFGEGNLVATHSTLFNLGPKPLVAFDVFRIENGKIAQHWDNLALLRTAPNPSGRTQVDGPTEVSDLAKTEANKALVIDLVQKMFINGEKLDVTKYINPKSYHQHNPDAGDGLQGLQKLMKANAAKGMKMRYDRIGITVAEGNFVLTGSAGAMGDKPTAFYDLWRIENGLIVEHWDIIAPIRTENLPAGYPGKF